MATYSAAEGSISVAGNTLGELKSFNFTQTADTKDTTNLASTSKTYVAGTLAFLVRLRLFGITQTLGKTH